METKQKLKTEERVQTIQLQKIKQESLTQSITKLALLTSIGVLGRVALQGIPSVEPLIPLSIAIGYFYGAKYGVSSGVSGFFASNFLVWGGQGPWTIFQCIGTGLAALTGAIFGKIKHSRSMFLLATLIGTILFELSVNTWWLITFGLFSIPLTLITSLPFSLVHIVSSLGFSMILYESRDKVSNVIKGEIIECKISDIRRLANSSCPDRRTTVKQILSFRKERNRRESEYRVWKR